MLPHDLLISFAQRSTAKAHLILPALASRTGLPYRSGNHPGTRNYSGKMEEGELGPASRILVLNGGWKSSLATLDVMADLAGAM